MRSTDPAVVAPVVVHVEVQPKAVSVEGYRTFEVSYLQNQQNEAIRFIHVCTHLVANAPRATVLFRDRGV